MEKIRKSVKNIMTISEDMSNVNAFARERFKEEFKDRKNIWFKSCEIVNEDTIKIIYEHGIHEGSFNINLYDK